MPLAVSIGEPAGIGPDIILAAWNERRQRKLPPFFVTGDPALLTRRAAALGTGASIAALRRGESLSPLATTLPVVAVEGVTKGSPGRPDGSDAGATVEAIRLAAEMTIAGEAGGVVTCPIAKSVLYGAGFEFPGHTEFLAHLAAEATGRPVRPVMMIASEALRTVPVTIHLPLRQAIEALTSELIVETCSIVDTELRNRFAIAEPRMVLTGLNPHAGEDGTLGTEDRDIIAPAVARLRSMGVDASGPWPADTLFHERARRRYDVAVCMYHDQALIPAKTLAFDEGVNVTLGLPFIRTSPDHGTALDIAGTGKADPSSFCAALRMAWEMARRAQDRGMTAA